MFLIKSRFEQSFAINKKLISQRSKQDEVSCLNAFFYHFIDIGGGKCLNRGLNTNVECRRLLWKIAEVGYIEQKNKVEVKT